VTGLLWKKVIIVMAEKFTLNSSGEKLFDMADYSRSCAINDRTNFLIIRITGAEKEIIFDWENNLMIYMICIYFFLKAKDKIRKIIQSIIN